MNITNITLVIYSEIWGFNLQILPFLTKILLTWSVHQIFSGQEIMQTLLTHDLRSRIGFNKQIQQRRSFTLIIAYLVIHKILVLKQKENWNHSCILTPTAFNFIAVYWNYSSSATFFFTWLDFCHFLFFKINKYFQW